jgi:nucleotide-binding universal stress UspA family protein
VISFDQKEGTMKILLATDGSEYSEDSARFLTRFPLTPSDEIVVLHAVSEIPYEDDYKAQLRQIIRKVAPKILKSAAEILGPSKANITMIEEDGYPAMTITEMAEKLGSDLVVMGARGVRGVKLLFLGSTTREVAINSARPILVTKSPLKEAATLKVLFAADGSDSSNAAGKFLTLLPFPEGAEVTVINVSGSVLAGIPEKYLKEIETSAKEEAARAETRHATASEKIIEEAAAWLSSGFRNINRLTVRGDPTTEILREAKERDADIIAIGSRGLRGIKGMLGSVSRAVLGRAECAVLIGK